MSADTVTIPVERFSLGSLGELLAEQIDAETERIAAAFNDPEGFAGDKLKAELSIKLSFEFRVDRRACSVAATVHSKLPERKAAVRTLMLRDDGFLVDADDVQLDLINRKNG